MVVIINGAPGTGKSRTAEALLLKTPQSAWIDGDWLLAIHPRNGTNEERILRYTQIAGVAKTYYENGYTTIFISFVYPGPTSLSEQVELLTAIDQVKVVSLITDSEELRKRHLLDTYKREGIENSIELNNKISILNVDCQINNTNVTLDEVVAKIQEFIKC